MAVAGGPGQVVLGQPQQQAGFAAAGLGHRQEVAAQQLGRQVHRHALALVLGQADAAALGDRGRQRQPAAGGGPLQRRHLVGRLGQVPQTGQFAHV